LFTSTKFGQDRRIYYQIIYKYNSGSVKQHSFLSVSIKALSM